VWKENKFEIVFWLCIVDYGSLSFVAPCPSTEGKGFRLGMLDV